MPNRLRPSPAAAARGFTLIELIAVLVILGVLALAGAHAFSDLRADARAAAVRNVGAQLQEHALRAHVWFIQKGGDTTAAAAYEVWPCGGAGYGFTYGFPAHWGIDCWARVQGLQQGWGPSYSGRPSWRYFPQSEWHDGYVGQSRCHADYVTASATSPAYVVVDVSDCRQNNFW